MENNFWQSVLNGNWFYDYYRTMNTNNKPIDAHMFCQKAIQSYEQALKVLPKTNNMADLYIGRAKAQQNLIDCRHIADYLYRNLLGKIADTATKSGLSQDYNRNFMYGYVSEITATFFDSCTKKLQYLNDAINYYTKAVEIKESASKEDKFLITHNAPSLETAETFLSACKSKYMHYLYLSNRQTSTPQETSENEGD